MELHEIVEASALPERFLAAVNAGLLDHLRDSDVEAQIPRLRDALERLEDEMKVRLGQQAHSDRSNF